MVPVINETHCHKKNPNRRYSTTLVVFSKLFLKVLQISLENTCARYNVNTKVWLYALGLHLYLKETPRHSSFRVSFAEFFRTPFL